MSEGDRYREAGVDIEKGNLFVERIKSLVKSTHNSSVLGNIGGFSGMMSLNTSHYSQPVLVSSTDGVGTKLKIAFLMEKHDTVGIDLVAMCVNDIVVTGAKPLFMLDYLATGVLRVETAADIVKGVAEGCRQAGCALIGGETAEMPGFYPPGEYDLAGFAVGVVDRDDIVDGSRVAVGSALIGLASNGLHSNGYSLVRRIVFEEQKLSIDSRVPDLPRSVGEELLEPTKIYVESLLNLRRDFYLDAMAHITGGGILENLPRVLPGSCRAVLKRGSWDIPPIFHFLKNAGKLGEREMLRTFNSGLGMILVVPAHQADGVRERLLALHQPAWIVGEVKERKAGQSAVEID
ncbi:phosphoribosylaminoimidazole synthetase [Desulfocarbo indianensis]|nr:phosphoribosylaminoimidazole synthetase [Desulfocarbo indianensis]